MSEGGTTSNIPIFMPIKGIKLNQKMSLTQEAENVEAEQRTDGRNVFYTEGVIWNTKVRNKDVCHGAIYNTKHWKQSNQW